MNRIKETNRFAEKSPENVIRNSIKAETPFPQWYLLYGGGEVTGGVGLKRQKTRRLMPNGRTRRFLFSRRKEHCLTHWMMKKL